MRTGPSLCIFLLLAGCAGGRTMPTADPLDARQHNDLGVAYERRGEVALAEREYARAAGLAPSWAQAVVNLGNVRAAQGQWEDALETYRDAIQRDPRHAEAMNNLAWALLQVGRPAEALPWAERAAAVDGCGAACLHTLALVQTEVGQTREAVATIGRALASSPEPSVRAELEEARAALDRRLASP